jgi:hypothetical protein
MKLNVSCPTRAFTESAAEARGYGITERPANRAGLAQFGQSGNRGQIHKDVVRRHSCPVSSRAWDRHDGGVIDLALD